MIVWINGAFGSGKTSIAKYLKDRISNAFVFDPEETGFYLRENIPKEICPDDFQEINLWRSFNYQMLVHLSKEYDGLIIVPMTITNEDYFEEIIGQLKKDDIMINTYTLIASEETLLYRLEKRGDGRQSWAADQIKRCVTAHTKELFSKHIFTDQQSVESVGEYIIKDLQLK